MLLIINHRFYETIPLNISKNIQAAAYNDACTVQLLLCMYSWSIANNFVIDVYCRCLEILFQIVLSIAYLITLDLIEKIWYRICRHLQ